MPKRRIETLTWSLSTVKKKTAEALQKLRRLEEASANGFCQCVSCGAEKHWKQMQGGHFVGGRTNGVLFIEDNIHPQCSRCNQWSNSSDAATNYLLYMIDRYGRDRVEEIKRMRHVEVKFDKEELLEMRDEYNARIKVQLKRIK